VEKSGALLAAVGVNDREAISFGRSFMQPCRLTDSDCDQRAWTGHLTLGDHSVDLVPGVPTQVGEFVATGFVITFEQPCASDIPGVFFSVRIARRTDAPLPDECEDDGGASC
jgi:hypothetical protein